MFLRKQESELSWKQLGDFTLHQINDFECPRSFRNLSFNSENGKLSFATSTLFHLNDERVEVSFCFSDKHKEKIYELYRVLRSDNNFPYIITPDFTCINDGKEKSRALSFFTLNADHVIQFISALNKTFGMNVINDQLTSDLLKILHREFPQDMKLPEANKLKI